MFDFETFDQIAALASLPPKSSEETVAMINLNDIKARHPNESTTVGALVSEIESLQLNIAQLRNFYEEKLAEDNLTKLISQEIRKNHGVRSEHSGIVEGNLAARAIRADLQVGLQ